MALTPEKQAEFDYTAAVLELSNSNANTLNAKNHKLEAIRMAKEVLVENRRSKPVDEREVTASDITTFADTLITYINS